MVYGYVFAGAYVVSVLLIMIAMVVLIRVYGFY
jgi:hypothetical protein